MTPTKEELGAALDALLSRWIREQPQAASSIAVVAEYIASVARRVAEGERHSVHAAIKGSAAPSATPHDPPADAAPAPPPPPDAAFPQRPPLTARPAPAAFVPLKLGDGQPLQLKVPGNSAEIAAARFSAMEQDQPAQPEPPAHEAPDLPLIATRCTIKAESCRFVIERRAAAGQGRELEFAARVRDLLTRGKQLHNCFIWVVYPGAPQPDDASLGVIAAAYDNLAAASRLAERVPVGATPARRREALAFLAEAQSALRVALENTWLTRPDRDQDDAFLYLNDATTYEGVFVERHMRLSDPADPADAAGLAERIADFTARLNAAEVKTRQSAALVTRVRHHARLIAASPADDHARDWERIDAAVRDLEDVGAGRDPRIAESLRSVAAHIPADGAFARLREAAARLAGATADEEADDEAGAPPRYSPSVLRVRTMLRGGRVVLIGGERRPEAERRIRAAFELDDLEWLASPEHSSSAPLEAPIRRPDTRLVLVMIKLAGHHHIDDTRMYCERHNKPLVRLPAGYNPEQIAAQVIEQASGKLEGTPRLAL